MKITAARHALIQTFDFGWQSPETSAIELQAKIQGTTKSNIAQIMKGTIFSVIYKEVERLQPIPKAWAKYCYGNWDITVVPGSEHYRLVETWLYFWFSRWTEIQNKHPRFETAVACNVLLPVAIRDTKFRQSAKRAFTSEQIFEFAHLTKRQRNHYSRDIGPYYDKMLSLLDVLDKDMLRPIAALLATMNTELEEAV